jgi:hypothetical protein
MPSPERPTLTSTDLVAGVPVVVVGVLGTVSLALAHAHHHSLPAVLVVTALVLAALFPLVRRVGVRGDRNGTIAVLACGALAAVMFLPGFSYGVSDKDPGGYVAHSVEIARTGSYSFTDPALAHPTLPVDFEGPGARFAGIWVRHGDTGLMVPQFYHLWPALLATSYDAFGYGGITAATPLVGIVAVMALVGLLRRVGGVVAGAIGGVLIATNMLQVWQSKYPTTEVLAEALFVGTLLAVVIAVQERWRPAAFVAGLLVGVGFLNRADGWLLVMLGAATVATLWVTRRADGETAYGAAGLALLLPYALWQAYSPAGLYTASNKVPGLPKTLALLAILVVGALLARPLLRRAVDAVLALGARQRTQLLVGLAVCAGAAALMAVGFLRPKLFGEDHFLARGRVFRSYDEQNMRRLSWFFTLPGFALAGLGVAVVALRRWRTEAWAVVLPTMLLLPVFAWHARNSSRLMWWARRYVSNVLPGVIVLMALALAFAVAWEWRGRKPLRLPALLATAALVVVFLGQSLPLRSHDEWHGSFGVSQRISALSGDRRGIYLWERSPYCCAAPTSLWATPVWLERGELSVLLPGDEPRRQSYVDAYRAAFPGDPVFIVWTGPEIPAGVADLTPVLHLAGTLPFWEESDVARPSKSRDIPYDLTVYRVG